MSNQNEGSLEGEDDFLSKINAKFRYYTDFPEKGANFMCWDDIFLDHRMVRGLVETIADKYLELELENINNQIDYVVGLQSRGYLLGTLLAQELRCGFIPVKKQGKLPVPKISRAYSKEDGEDVLEMRADLKHGGKVVIIDDVLATGGSLRAAIELAKEAGFEVVDCVVIRDVPVLRQVAREKLGEYYDSRVRVVIV